MNAERVTRHCAAVLMITASTFSAAAADLNSNHLVYAILPQQYTSSKMAPSNGWPPTFDNIPVEKQAGVLRSEVEWGADTNNMAAGLLLRVSPNTNRTDIAMFPILRSDFTNRTGDGYSSSFWLLPVEYRYQMTLRDTRGNIVPMTERAKMHSKPFQINANQIDMYHGYQRCFLRKGHLLMVIPSPVVLRDCFDITNAGTYRLEFGVRAVRKLYIERKSEEYRLPVNVEIKIPNP